MVTFRSSACFLLVCFFFALFAGCGPEAKDAGEVAEPAVQAEVAFKFAAGEAGTYKFVAETIQDFSFEQPSLKKIKEEQTRSFMDIEFDQEIETVNDDGSAIAKITFKNIRMFMKGKSGVSLDFDSTRGSDKKNPLYRLIGKSYTVSLFPDGSAKPLDTKKALAAVSSPVEKRVAIALLNEKEVLKRHGVPGLPEPDQSTKAKGESWSKLAAGHEKLIPPKAFKKTYKVSKIQEKNGGQIVVVAMDGVESDERLEGLEDKSGMGFLGAMFDTKETYTGGMTFDSADGRVVSFNEKLIAEYIATDAGMGGSKDKEPDVLKMGLTYSLTLKTIKN